MKITILTFLLTGLTLHAAEENKVTTATGSVAVYSLTCVTPITGNSANNEKSKYTQVGGSRSAGPLLLNAAGIEPKMKHDIAIQAGCKIPPLNQIRNESLKYYNFRTSNVTLTQHTSKSERNGFGQCVAEFTETLSLDLGLGVVLTSEANQLQQKNDCE